jgi:hypothetical protein
MSAATALREALRLARRLDHARSSALQPLLTAALSPDPLDAVSSADLPRAIAERIEHALAHGEWSPELREGLRTWVDSLTGRGAT